MSTSDLPAPDFSRNMRIIGHSDQGGRPDGVQLMVHRGYAYVGHMFSKGFSVIDARDPTKPTPVNYVPAQPDTWNIHLQTQMVDLLELQHRDAFVGRIDQRTGMECHRSKRNRLTPRTRNQTTC